MTVEEVVNEVISRLDSQDIDRIRLHRPLRKCISAWGFGSETRHP